VHSRNQFLTFGAPFIEEPEIEEIVDSLRSGWLGTGPKVQKFEDLFRARIGSAYAVAVNSCTAALHLSLVVAGIGPGDEVITTDMTFVSTANAIIHCGAHPVLVDCDRQTGLISPQAIEDAVTARTRAIIPVHLYGRPCAMDDIMDIANRHDCVVIEDAAHAFPGVYRKRNIGTIGHFTCFSFYVTKNITTGEGGMVTTQDGQLAEKIRIYSMHGLNRDAWRRYSDEPGEHYVAEVPGFKYNMTDLQAALGIHQLGKLDRMRERRTEIWRRYADSFADLPVGLPPAEEADTVHARHLYTLLIDECQCGIGRDQFAKKLFELKIGSGIHFTGIHLQPYYQRRFGYRADDFPNSTWISKRTVSLPFSASLTDADVDDVIAAIKYIVA
jgi:dTDP-4-amino-4,6-dideoxygalactose transaminase